MNFATYKDAKIALAITEQMVCETGNRLKLFRQGNTSANGLLKDEVKFSPEYKTVKAAFDKHFNAQRFINKFINKHFKKERLAELRAKK